MGGAIEISVYLIIEDNNMSDIIERHKELSRTVLSPDGHKTSQQKMTSQIHRAPSQILYLFFFRRNSRVRHFCDLVGYLRFFKISGYPAVSGRVHWNSH
ncbi:MAG: hypothetical protein AYP45_04015 [Candidatus Brocadia carolinensis]|uniref:Uncharacterized protein n=1 Tax=Candidatus Brocadia carolinensis TaxID=1004156 RepID=A0A1V4AW84_9BACT|nr:MAG: hypothetical protein AYP45_04015 [Candidatus Brocadia caroliniensis]